MAATAPFRFTLQHVDAASSARRGVLATPHGLVETPAFMPVGTQGTVKGVDAGRLAETGAQMILANTYHLALRPGEEVVASLGGLHAFMGWPGPILTDSGGFQIFSLAQLCRVDDEGVVFRSHVDGSLFELTPERAVQIQEQLGPDIMMCLDECLPHGTEPERLAEAVRRTVAWAARCRDAHQRADQALFGQHRGQ